jgi:CLIP-associating protein 1/2
MCDRQAFKNPSADVRKAVVFTLVELYMTLGDHFTPYLEQLNTVSFKTHKAQRSTLDHAQNKVHPRKLF